MDILFFVAIAAAIAGVLTYKNKRYKETSYYKITKKPYWFMDKGSYGEYLIYERLRHLENDGRKFLFNIFLPKGNDKTTEIDVLLICSKGLFVFESKNYDGWIFGDESYKSWTQTFAKGRGRSHKERFYNPVMQNASHISYLRRHIGESIPVWSIIVFSDKCTLKKVIIRNRNIDVINLCEITLSVSRIFDQAQVDVLKMSEIDAIYSKLYAYTQVSQEIKKKHAQDVSSIGSPQQ